MKITSASRPYLPLYPRLSGHCDSVGKFRLKFGPEPGCVLLKVAVEPGLTVGPVSRSEPNRRGAAEDDSAKTAGRKDVRNVRLDHELFDRSCQRRLHLQGYFVAHHVNLHRT